MSLARSGCCVRETEYKLPVTSHVHRVSFCCVTIPRYNVPMQRGASAKRYHSHIDASCSLHRRSFYSLFSSLSLFVLSRLASSYLVLSRSVPFCSVSTRLVSSRLVSSCFAPPRFVSSRFVSSHPVPFHTFPVSSLSLSLSILPRCVQLVSSCRSFPICLCSLPSRKN